MSSSYGIVLDSTTTSRGTTCAGRILSATARISAVAQHRQRATKPAPPWPEPPSWPLRSPSSPPSPRSLVGVVVPGPAPLPGPVAPARPWPSSHRRALRPREPQLRPAAGRRSPQGRPQGRPRGGSRPSGRPPRRPPASSSRPPPRRPGPPTSPSEKAQPDVDHRGAQPLERRPTGPRRRSALVDGGPPGARTGRREAEGRTEIVMDEKARWVTAWLPDEKKPVTGIGGSCANGTSMPGRASTASITAVHRAWSVPGCRDHLPTARSATTASTARVVRST